MAKPPESELCDPQALSLWKGYLRRLRSKRRQAVPAEWAMFEEDIEIHVTEHLRQTYSGSQAEHLQQVLKNLGKPEDLSRDFLLQAGSRERGFFESLGDHARSTMTFALRSLFTTIALILFVMCVAHIFNGDVGLWMHGARDWTLSFQAQPGATQLFRDSFPLIALGIGAILLAASRWMANSDDTQTDQ